MADYSTAISMEGRESFKGMATVRIEPASLAEKMISSRQMSGKVKDVGRNRVSITIGEGEGTLGFKDRINPKAVMPGDNVTIHINVRSLDSTGVGELRGGSLEMVLEPNHLF